MNRGMFRTKEEIIKRRSDYGKLIEAYAAYLYSRFVHPGDYVVDAGVNWGMHFYQLADIVGPDGRVFGYEANPELAKRSKVGAQQRGFHNCVVYPNALYSSHGSMQFTVYKNQLGLSHISHDGPLHPSIKDDNTEMITVESVVLDDIAELPITFIKSDLEGADFRALQGGELLLRRHKPLLIFETIPYLNMVQHNFGLDEFVQFFEGLGYLLFNIHGFPVDQSQLATLERGTYHEFLGLHKSAPYLGEALLETCRFWNSCLEWDLIEDWRAPPFIGRNPPSLAKI